MATYKKPLHKGDDFRNWLITEKGLTYKSAGDVVSRCKRIESILDIELKQSVVSKARYEEIFMQLLTDFSPATKTKTKNTTVYGPLRRALRLYAEFLVGEKALDYVTGFKIEKR